MITYQAPVETIIMRAAEAIAADARRQAIGGLGDVIGIERDGAGTLVRVQAAHAVFVEFGTSRMAARPFLGPAVEGLRGRLGGLI